MSNHRGELYYQNGTTGDTVITSDAGFATASDSGFKCSGLIRDVMNLHMLEMIDDGIIDMAWDQFYSFSEDVSCEVFKKNLLEGSATTAVQEVLPTIDDETGYTITVIPPSSSDTNSSEAPQNRKRDLLVRSLPQNSRRKLKGGKASSSSSSSTMNAEDSQEAKRLSIRQMAGTFVLHYILTGISVALALISTFSKKLLKEYAKEYKKMKKGREQETAEDDDEEEITKNDHRNHYPSNRPLSTIPDNDVIPEEKSVDFSRRQLDESDNSSPGHLGRTGPLNRRSAMPRRSSVFNLLLSGAELMADTTNRQHEDHGTSVHGHRAFAKKPILMDKDSRYLQLQLEEVQEAQEEMHRQLQQQRDYMQEHFGEISHLLTDLKRRMPKSD